MGFSDLEYLSESEITTDFIPGGNILSFVPGGNEPPHSEIPGKSIENGRYIGLVRMWGNDRRLDLHFRIVNNELEEKRDYYYNGEQFFTGGWISSRGSWDGTVVKIPEGYTHTLRSFIECHLGKWSYDEINEVWWERYEEHY